MPYESQMISSLRIFMGGSTNVMIIPASDLHIYLHQAEKNPTDKAEMQAGGVVHYPLSCVSKFLEIQEDDMHVLET